MSEVNYRCKGMTLRDKIVKIASENGCRRLSDRAVGSLVEMIECECSERVHVALQTKSVGKLLGEFAAFLDSRGFEVDSPEDVHQEAPETYRFAKQIFKNRDVLVPFLCKVALEVGGGKAVSYSVCSAETANVLFNFLNGLTQSGHALEWRATGNDFYVQIPADESKRRFFRSEWAEECFRYVISKTVNAASEKFGVRNKIIPNVRIRRKGETSEFTEFDVVAQLGGRFYVFEVKSGPWVRILQWAAREQAFVTKDGPFRVIVCTIHNNIPCEIFEPQILVNLENFEDRVSRLFEADFADAVG